MSDNDRAAEAEAVSHGLFDSGRRLLASIVGIAHNRLDLLGTEIEEQGARLAALLAWGLAALSLTLTALLMCVLALVVVFWDTHRVPIAVGAACFLVIVAAVSVYGLLSQAKARPRLFNATLQELARDRERLTRP